MFSAQFHVRSVIDDSVLAKSVEISRHIVSFRAVTSERGRQTVGGGESARLYKSPRRTRRAAFGV